MCSERSMIHGLSFPTGMERTVYIVDQRKLHPVGSVRGALKYEVSVILASDVMYGDVLWGSRPVRGNLGTIYSSFKFCTPQLVFMCSNPDFFIAFYPFPDLHVWRVKVSWLEHSVSDESLWFIGSGFDSELASSNVVAQVRKERRCARAFV